jgi:hypothetical protein
MSPFGHPLPPPSPSPSPPSAMYAPYPASLPIALPEPPPSNELPAWQRALLIGGTVAVAIVIAFVIALRVRGPARVDRPASPAASPTSAVSPHRPQPRFAPDARADPRGSAIAEDDAAADAPIVGAGPCRFTIATTPAGSIVRVDDQAIGASPLTIDGSCAKHKIDIAHARYQSATRWVTLAADKPQQLEVSLTRPIHDVSVTSSPSGADVLIDGHRAGTTPTVIQVTGFAAVRLTFRKPGYHSLTKRVYSKLAQDAVAVQLAP